MAFPAGTGPTSDIRAICAGLLAWVVAHKAKTKEEKRLDYQRHRNKRDATAAAWASRNRDKSRNIGRSAAFRAKYGIDYRRYSEMLNEQDFGCYVCAAPHVESPYRVLQVDHDHNTGAVRRLLCRRCNDLLGKGSENSALLRALADYLDEFAAPQINQFNKTGAIS